MKYHRVHTRKLSELMLIDRYVSRCLWHIAYTESGVKLVVSYELYKRIVELVRMFNDLKLFTFVGPICALNEDLHLAKQCLEACEVDFTTRLDMIIKGISDAIPGI